jgi:hypothetical protein
MILDTGTAASTVKRAATAVNETLKQALKAGYADENIAALYKVIK